MRSNDPDRIPVTIVSGYLGAGKTTLVNHLLSNPGERDLAVIVNDMGEVNVDAALIEREREEAGIVDLSNGCICCRLRGDLIEEATRLAERREFDCLVVESSGISEPIPVARALTEGTPSSDVDPTERFRLDTMVTVLDTYGFWKEFDAGERLPGPDEDRPLATVLIEGIEFCDVLLCNKADAVPEEVLAEIDAVVETLAPRAERYRTEYARVDPEAVLDTGLFDFDEATRSQGWRRLLSGDGHDHRHDDGHDDHHGDGHDDHAEGGRRDEGDDHVPHGSDADAAELHDVSSFVYRETRPFHPERLADWLGEWDGSIIRSKGVCHVAGCDDVIGVSQAGPSIQAGPIGEWREEDDRRTQLVFIGREFSESSIRARLGRCLLDETEETDGTTVDPFPIETTA